MAIEAQQDNVIESTERLITISTETDNRKTDEEEREITNHTKQEDGQKQAPRTTITTEIVTREASNHEYHPEKPLCEEDNREHKEEVNDEEQTSAGSSHEDTL